MIYGALYGLAKPKIPSVLEPRPLCVLAKKKLNPSFFRAQFVSKAAVSAAMTPVTSADPYV